MIERLTVKDLQGTYEVKDRTQKVREEIVNKLGKIEDKEVNLKFEILQLLEILEKGVYVFDPFTREAVYFNGNEIRFDFAAKNIIIDRLHLRLATYGSVWSLNAEDFGRKR